MEAWAGTVSLRASAWNTLPPTWYLTHRPAHSENVTSLQAVYGPPLTPVWVKCPPLGPSATVYITIPGALSFYWVTYSAASA